MQTKIKQPSKKLGCKNKYYVRDGIAYLTITRMDGSEHKVRFDAEDIERVRRYRWRILTGRKGYTDYVAHQISRSQCWLLHRLIVDAPEGMEVDIINGDGLDCRKSNLRVTTHSGVMKTNRKARSISLKLPAYITVDQRFRGFIAKVPVKHRSHNTQYVGRFPTVKEAVRAQKAYVEAKADSFAKDRLKQLGVRFA